MLVADAISVQKRRPRRNIGSNGLFFPQQAASIGPSVLYYIKRLPVVLSRDEVQKVLAQLNGIPWLMASMIYGG